MHIKALFQVDATRLYVALFSVWCLLAPIVVHAEGESVAPYQSWTLRSTASTCDNVIHTFQSSWPGDDPMALMQKYVELLNEKCSGSSGALFVVTHTLNACTPTIGVYSNGAIVRSGAHVEGCTYRRHIDPKPECTTDWLCHSSIQDQSMPQPAKWCEASGQSGTLAEFPS